MFNKRLMTTLSMQCATPTHVQQPQQQRASAGAGGTQGRSRVNTSKRLLSAQLGRALADSQLHASLLVVLCPPAALGRSPTSISSRVPPAPPSLAAVGSVSALAGLPKRADKEQEAELTNLHLMEPEDGGTEAGYEEDDEDDGEEERERAARALPTLTPQASMDTHDEGGTRRTSFRDSTAMGLRPEEERQPRRTVWRRQLSLRRGRSNSSMPSAASALSLDELLECGTIIP